MNDEDALEQVTREMNYWKFQAQMCAEDAAIASARSKDLHDTIRALRQETLQMLADLWDEETVRKALRSAFQRGVLIGRTPEYWGHQYDAPNPFSRKAKPNMRKLKKEASGAA